MINKKELKRINEDMQAELARRRRFESWYSSLPVLLKRNLVWMPSHRSPYTMQVIWLEIKNCTRFGDQLLAEMGF